jgi:hypothetical protein
MTEIDDIHLAENEGQPGRHNEQQHTGDQAVEKLDEQTIHGIMNYEL